MMKSFLFGLGMVVMGVLAPRAEVVVTVDVSEAPELEAWGQQAKTLIEEWYQRTINLLPSKGAVIPQEITFKIQKTDKGVAWASGSVIVVASHWIESHPEDIGCVYHELVHVVQNYQQRYPGWIVEGIADYLRWAIYEGKPLSWFPFSEKPRGYTDSYRVTGGFFLWLESDVSPGIVKKLNKALRDKTYTDESFFTNETTKTLDTLWGEYLKERTQS